jgi:hypothetical protein
LRRLPRLGTSIPPASPSRRASSKTRPAILPALASSLGLHSRSSCPGRSSRRSPMLGASSAPTSFPRSTRCRRPTARRCTPSTSSCRTC